MPASIRRTSRRSVWRGPSQSKRNLSEGVQQVVGRAANSFLHHLLHAKGKFDFPCRLDWKTFHRLIRYSQIEGIFEMTTPNILLGYSKQPAVWPDSSVDRVPQIRNSVHLTISVSLEPLFDPTELTTSNLECTELADVKVNHPCSTLSQYVRMLTRLDFRTVCASGTISSKKSFRIDVRIRLSVCRMVKGFALHAWLDPSTHRLKTTT